LTRGVVDGTIKSGKNLVTYTIKERDMERRRRALTTGQMAEYCQVRPATVFNWIKGGKLKAYSTPGGHYRVRLEDFLDFLEKYEIPIDEDFFASPGSRILIVDDEPNVVEFIERALSGAGEDYLFERASDGYEAGLKVASFEPNLVILDLVMPRVDGFEVCRRIKTDLETLGTKVLVVTGYPEEVERAKECGADDYLVKPLRVEELREKVSNLMRRRAPATASRRG